MLRFAFANLLNRKARSALALLGLTVAIAGMVGLFSIVEGLERTTQESFGRISGILVLQSGAPIPLFSRLPAEWEDDLKSIEGVQTLCPELWVRVNVIDGKMILNPPRFLSGIEISSWNALRSAIYRDDIVEGRFLDESDRGTRNAVIARSIQEEFELELGDRFAVNGEDATLVGVYETGSWMIDVTILMDIQSVRRQASIDPAIISAFYLEAESDDLNEIVIERIKDRFRGREGAAWQPSSMMTGQTGNPVENLLGGFDRWIKSQTGKPQPANPQEATETPAPPLPPEQEPLKKSGESRRSLDIKEHLQVDESLPIEVQTGREWGERFEKFTSDLDFIMLILTSIGMTIAALGVVNTMLMSVSERIIEIGILKANGWSRRNVLSLIACESSLLGFGGGCVGSVIGWLATLVLNAFFPDRVDLYAGPELIGFSICFSTALGLLAGLYPAFWAMRMMPMDAIRRG